MIDDVAALEHISSLPRMRPLVPPKEQGMRRIGKILLSSDPSTRADFVEFQKRYTTLIKIDPDYAANMFEYFRSACKRPGVLVPIPLAERPTSWFISSSRAFYLTHSMDPRIAELAYSGYFVDPPGGAVSSIRGEGALEDVKRSNQWRYVNNERLDKMIVALMIIDSLAALKSTLTASQVEGLSADTMKALKAIFDLQQMTASSPSVLVALALVSIQARIETKTGDSKNVISMLDAADKLRAAVGGSYRGLNKVYVSFFGSERFFNGLHEAANILAARSIMVDGRLIFPPVPNAMMVAKVFDRKDGLYGMDTGTMSDPDAMFLYHVKELDVAHPDVNKASQGQTIKLRNVVMRKAQFDPCNTIDFAPSIESAGGTATNDANTGPNAVIKTMWRVDEYAVDPTFDETIIPTAAEWNVDSRAVVKAAILQYSQGTLDSGTHRGQGQVVDAYWAGEDVSGTHRGQGQVVDAYWAGEDVVSRKLTVT